MKTNKVRLYEVAEAQRGFFTAKQARSCGYVSANHPYHVRAGTWVREHRGIYRLSSFPRSPEGQYVQWALWSRGRDDKPVGVYSHQTALSLHEISDVMPSKLHMTVPPSFRRNAPVPRILVIHKAALEPQDIEEKDGYRVVKPLRAIISLIDEGTEDRSHLRSALREALHKGLVTRRQVEQHPRRKELRTLLGGRLK